MTIYELLNSIIFLNFKTSLVIAPETPPPPPQRHYNALRTKIDMWLTPNQAVFSIWTMRLLTLIGDLSCLIPLLRPRLKRQVVHYKRKWKYLKNWQRTGGDPLILWMQLDRFFSIMKMHFLASFSIFEISEILQKRKFEC